MVALGVLAGAGLPPARVGRAADARRSARCCSPSPCSSRSRRRASRTRERARVDARARRRRTSSGRATRATGRGPSTRSRSSRSSRSRASPSAQDVRASRRGRGTWRRSSSSRRTRRPGTRSGSSSSRCCENMCAAYQFLNKAYTLDPAGQQWVEGGPLDVARDAVNAGACEPGDSGWAIRGATVVGPRRRRERPRACRAGRARPGARPRRTSGSSLTSRRVEVGLVAAERARRGSTRR